MEAYEQLQASWAPVEALLPLLHAPRPLPFPLSPAGASLSCRLARLEQLRAEQQTQQETAALERALAAALSSCASAADSRDPVALHTALSSLRRVVDSSAPSSAPSSRLRLPLLLSRLHSFSSS